MCVGAAADQNLLVDTRAGGNLLSAPQGLNHFLNAARQAAAEVIVLDPLYSTHDQDENDTRSKAALCQSLLRLSARFPRRQFGCSAQRSQRCRDDVDAFESERERSF
jgi:hypothetical protein